MSSLKQLRKALNLSRDEVALFRSALDTAREQGALETLRIVKGWDERKHPRGQPGNAGQFVGAERAPLFELADDDETDHSEIHDKWSDEDSAIESEREQEREARDQKHDKARERDREDAQDRSVEGWRSDDKRIVKERQIEDENREWARVREDEKAFARIRREVTRDRESELTAARRVRDKALATIDREYKQREEEVFKLDNSEETGEDPPAEYYKQLDALEKWHEQRLSKAEKEYEKATEAIDEKYDGEFASRREQYRDQQDAARRAEDERISDARQKEDDELEAQRDADLESFGEKYDEETERLRAEMHAKHDADHASRDRERYHARRESHPDAHAAYYADDDHKRYRGELKAFNPSQPRDDAGRWSGSAHKPTHNLTDAQRSTLKQLALLFPDGVHHLLDDSGRVSDAALGVAPEQSETALREQIDQHRAAWHAVNDQINDLLREVQRTEGIDTADELLNREIEYTLFRGEFDALRDNEATAGIADALDAAQNSEFPSHPILPWDLHFARDAEQEISETGHESLATQADDYARAVGEHKARLEELAARTEGTREQAERESAKFRSEQRQHLEHIAGECAKALEGTGLGESRAAVEDLAARVTGLLTHFPASERKALVTENDIRAGGDNGFRDPAPYGYCPECREPGIMCERRLDGNAYCANKHCYPRKKAKYASTQVELTGRAKRKLLAMAAQIADKDLGEDGREEEPHITARYGLHADGPEQVERLVDGFGVVHVKLGSLNAFRGDETGKDYDVIYAEVESPDLVRLNELLAGLPHTQTWATYKPHATVGYVKAGLAALGTANEEATIKRLTFSTAKRDKTVLRLTAGERKAFDPNEPRDKVGRWTKNGGGSDIDPSRVNSESTPWADTNYVQWHDKNDNEHQIYVETGEYSPEDEDEDKVTVYRFVSFDHKDNRDHEGEWVLDRDEAKDAGREFAEQSHHDAEDNADEENSGKTNDDDEADEIDDEPAPEDNERPSEPNWSEVSYYHGSLTPISEFANVTGRGISFSTDEGHAREFGHHMHEVQLDVRKPLDLTSLGTGAGEEGEDSDDRVSSSQIQEALAEYGIKVKFDRSSKGWTTDIMRSKMPEIIAQAKAKGYDALLVMDYKEWEAEETVVFDPDQIRLVRN